MSRYPMPPRNRVDRDPVVLPMFATPARPAPAGPSRSIPAVTPPYVVSAPVPRRADPIPRRQFATRG